MSLRTILVCLTTEASAATLMPTACLLARRTGAHLIGLHTLEALVVYPGLAMHVPEPAFAGFNAAQTATAEAIEAAFRRWTESESFVAEWRCRAASSTTAATRMLESARAADLVIVAQEDPETDRMDQDDIQQRLIRQSGRPVLVVPPGYAGATLGTRVTLGWSPTREAARAAHDSVELFDETAEVRIIAVDPRHEAESPSAETAQELAATLARHGARAEVVQRLTGGDSVTDILLDEARASGADLIVSGAFGHSRIFDFVVGAATLELMRQAPVPVLFSK